MNGQFEPKLPIGMIRYDELLNILKALNLTDCDKRTLAIVAEATGLGDWWPRQNQVRVEVETPFLLLDKGAV